MNLPQGATLIESKGRDIKLPPGATLVTDFQDTKVKPIDVSKSKSTSSITDITKDALSEAGDVALGMVEGPLALAAGMASFTVGVPYAAPKVLEGVVSGSGLKAGLSAAKDEADKFMNEFSYQPKSRFGQTIASVVASPFTVAHEFLGTAAKDKAWIESLTPEQKSAIARGDIQDPKTLKEEWLKNNPKAGEDFAKATQFLFDAALLGLPTFKESLSGSKTPKPKSLQDFAKSAVESVAEDAPQAVKAAVGVEGTEVVAKALKDHLKKTEITIEDVKFEGNKDIVQALREDAISRQGRGKAAYNKAAKIVAELDKDASEIDLQSINGIGPKTHARIKEIVGKREIDLTSEMEQIPPSEPSVEPPAESAPLAKPASEKLTEAVGKPTQVENLRANGITEESSLIKSVVQDAVDQNVTLANAHAKKGRLDIAKQHADIAVENANKFREIDPVAGELADKALEKLSQDVKIIKDTKVGDALIAAKDATKNPENVISSRIPTFETKDIAKGEGYEVKDRRRFTNQKSAQKAAEAKNSEVVQIGNKFAITSRQEPLIQNFRTLAEAETSFDMGTVHGASATEIPKAQALKEAREYRDTEFKVVKVGDKYYRATTKVEMSSPDTPQDGLKLLKGAKLVKEPARKSNVEISAQSTEVPLLKGIIVDGQRVSFTDAHQKLMEYRKRYIEKINTANSKPLTPQDAPAVEPRFATFNDPKAAQAWKDSHGLQGELIQDPITGEWFVEPELPELSKGDFDSYGESSDLRGDDYGPMLNEEMGVDWGESSDPRSLWDIMNNEKGSIDITALRRQVNNAESLIRYAKKIGKTLEEATDSLGLSPETTQSLLNSVPKIQENRDKLRELDPINEGILNPEGEVLSQRTRKDGTRFVAITKKWADAAINARKSSWEIKRSSSEGFVKRHVNNTMEFLSKGMEITETRLNAFRHFGPKWEQLWSDWTAKVTDSTREHKQLLIDLKELKKKLTRKERRDLAIAAYAAQEGGLRALASMGIKEIPIMTPAMLEVYGELRNRFDNYIERINYVRVNTGMKPIPRIDNYITFIRAHNILKKFGIDDGLSTATIGKLNSQVKEFTGVFNPYAKARTGAVIPIELDVFNAMDRYAHYALKEIHVAPIAALAKELATQKIGGVKVSKRAKKLVGEKLTSLNPDLAKVLSQWADEILGIDRLGPARSKVIEQLGQNISVALIAGNISTALKQFSAVRNSIADSGFTNVLKGGLRYAGEKAIKGGHTRAYRYSNILEIRKGDIALQRIAEQVAVGNITGFKKGLVDVTNIPMSLLDSMTAEMSWNAAYSKATGEFGLEGGGRGTPAAIYADKSVVKTQALGLKGNVSPLHYTTMGPILSILQTFAISDFNFLARDVLGIKNPDITKIGQVKTVVRFILGTALVNAAYRGIGMDAPLPEPITVFQQSKEEGDSNITAAAKAGKELFEVIPVVGGSAKFGTSLMGAVGEFMSEAPDTVQAVIDTVDLETATPEQKFETGMLLLTTIGKLRGWPMTQQIRKSVRTWSRGGDGWEIIIGKYMENVGGGKPQPPTPPTPGLPNL